MSMIAVIHDIITGAYEHIDTLLTIGVIGFVIFAFIAK